MTNLKYNSENKRIPTVSNGVANIPTEDSENERITIYSGSGQVGPDPQVIFVGDPEGYYTIEGVSLSEEYLDPEDYNLVPDEDGYISVPDN